MTDDVRPTATLLPTGLASLDSQPATAEDAPWDVVHVGTADTPDHGAQALMRTSDGDFRISAAEVDGKVGLKIERYHPHDESDGSSDSSTDDQEQEQEQAQGDVDGPMSPPAPDAD